VAVLFWHYQHFFVPPVEYGFHVRRSAVVPLYHALAWLYDYGHTAVQYFWAVSGFVFAHVYLADTQGRGRFWLARVARLWPLHLLTLMLVAVLQAAYAGLNGTDFIYHQNNLKHFLLSLPLMQYWGWQDNQSFNGPSWSLSTEMLAYAVFWLTLPALRRAPLALGAADRGGLRLGGVRQAARPGRDGLHRLFLRRRGGLWHGAARLAAPGHAAAAGRAAGGGGVLGLERLAIARHGDPGRHFRRALPHACARSGRPPRSLRHRRQLGDASYGIYLWHFPCSSCWCC
jgi:peptidoglycan/LPS O-acetylase OafA/YrhL